jgi:hypothetical protein
MCYDAIINQSSREIHVLVQADFGIMYSFSLGVQISNWKWEVNLKLLMFCSLKRNNKLYLIRKCCILNISVHMSAL